MTIKEGETNKKSSIWSSSSWSLCIFCSGALRVCEEPFPKLFLWLCAWLMIKRKQQQITPSPFHAVALPFIDTDEEERLERWTHSIMLTLFSTPAQEESPRRKYPSERMNTIRVIIIITLLYISRPTTTTTAYYSSLSVSINASSSTTIIHFGIKHERVNKDHHRTLFSSRSPRSNLLSDA